MAHPHPYPNPQSPIRSATLDTLFPQSERDFLAGYVPWHPTCRKGGDRRAHRHDGWTPTKQKIFLLSLRYHRSVTRAAESVGMARETAYALRKRWQPFADHWDLARGAQACTVADLLLRQVLEGVEEPVVRRGEIVGWRRMQRLGAGLWLLKQLRALSDGRPRRVKRVQAPLGWRDSGLAEALLGPGRVRR